jgi:hypothetical protein
MGSAISGFLTITSFVIHYSGWQARDSFWEVCQKCSFCRPVEANPLVNTSRRVRQIDTEDPVTSAAEIVCAPFVALTLVW